MNDKVFLLDTNILVYAFDKSEAKKQRKAMAILEQCFLGRKNYAVSAQNIAEFFQVITRKIENPLSHQEAHTIIQRLQWFKGITHIYYQTKTVTDAIKFREEHKLHFWDALIIATMLENNIFHIYTENEKDFTKIKNLSVVNPFK